MPRRLTCTNLCCTNDTLAAGNSYDYIFYMEPDTRPIRKFWLDKARPNNVQRGLSFSANLLRKCRGVGCSSPSVLLHPVGSGARHAQCMRSARRL